MARRTTQPNQTTPLLPTESFKVKAQPPANRTTQASSPDATPRSSSQSFKHFFQTIEVGASAVFNKTGQRDQAQQQLNTWGHTEAQAKTLANTPDYPRQHALVFTTLLSPPPFRLLTTELSLDDLNLLHIVCNAWFKAGNAVAAFQLVCAVFKGRPKDLALMRSLLCTDANITARLLEGFDPEVAKALVPGILGLAENGWAEPNTPTFVNPTSRGLLEKLVQSAAPQEWMRLRLISAEQLVRAAQPLRSAHAAEHIQHMKDLFDRAPADWRDGIVACARGLAALVDPQNKNARTVNDRARRLQARHDTERLQQHARAMSDWFTLDVTPPAGLDERCALKSATFKSKVLARQDPPVQENAKRVFREWLMLQATSFQGLSGEQLSEAMHRVAGKPPSRAWIPLAFELELALAGMQRDQARGDGASAQGPLKLLQSAPADFKLNATQLAQALAATGHAAVDSDTRFLLLTALLNCLPPRATAPLLHKRWLDTVLDPSTVIGLEFRDALIQIKYLANVHPLDQDDVVTRKLHEMLTLHRLARERAKETPPELLQSWFKYLATFIAEPRPETDWTVWRALASAWMREMVAVQDMQSPAAWTSVIDTLLTLARADASKPQECSARLAELLNDTVERLPREQALNWLRALNTQTTDKVVQHQSVLPVQAYPVELAALCGAARALIDSLSDTPPPLDRALNTSPTDDNVRVLDMFRHLAHAALLYQGNQVQQAAILALQIRSAIHISLYDDGSFPPGLYDFFKAASRSYPNPQREGDGELSKAFDLLKV